MKIIKILPIAALLFLNCEQKEKPLEANHYRINGSVTGLENGEIYLSKYPDMDTIKVENGRFTIENKLEEPVEQIALLKESNGNGSDKETYLSLFVEPEIMDLELIYSDFSKSKITGSKTQDDYYRLAAVQNQISDNYKKELDAFEEISKK
ncbi:DUF4369 domain-containing protein [Aureibaculum sp. 2210JD6-5]|uniref:DUF4369 domain-containing protein n=1 Tax=Aureibaculum sp. 2210JD6-5 TaxID=3103957 RepID=UPI002AAE5D3A|nr:DUF4369 domain-containing protein [Aureibaculum sp. 2210JD6-5]MDY7396945.1 DUF4369 domain-containing protein [Aureibaculum sp. 2210JD6-5]